MERSRRSGWRSSAEWRSAATRVVILVLALQAAACGGGGGGGGGDSSSATEDLQVGDTATFLSRDEGAPANADPRTAHRVQFTLSGLANPRERLKDEAIEVRRDGRLDVEARVSLAAGGTTKRDLTLIVDVSGSLTAQDLQDVKKSAQDFVSAVLPVAGKLRLYTFASPIETDLIGTYEAMGNDTSGFSWSPSPDAAIQAIRGGSDSTALFHAVATAIGAISPVPIGHKNTLVVFSDGRENSSPPGAREEALALIKENDIRVLSVGFGKVDADDLRRLSTGNRGRFVGVQASLVGLFDEVAREVLSDYTLVYDTPVSFGSLVLDVSILAERRHFHFQTSVLAGIDLARAAIGRYPTLPGSSVTLRDLRTTPPTTTTYTVASLEAAKRRADGFLALAVDTSGGCSGTGCGRHFQGVFGAGAESETGEVYLPSVLTPGAIWTDPVSHEEFKFVGFEEHVVLRGSRDQRKYRCAVVEFSGGRHWFVPEIGLVGTVDLDENPVVELAEPPCLATDFSGVCSE